MFRKLTLGIALVTGLLIAGSLPADAQGRRAPAGGGQSGKAVPRPSPPVAQPRPPAQGHPGGGGYYGGGHYGGYYGSPHHYLGIGYYGGGYPWFWGLGWGWGWGWGWWGAPMYPAYPYYGWGYPTASVRIQVEPKTAEVFVDGHLAGIVDDFDGMFQRLSVEPGGREITVYKEGFRSYRERLYLRADKGTTIKQALQPLEPGEPGEPRPVPSLPVVQETPPAWAPQRPGVETLPELLEPMPAAPPSNFGQVAIRVQPADAEILIDDEPWRGPAGAERLMVHLRPGVHRVEIRKEGFDPFVTSVEIKKGETTVVNVSLGRLTGV